MEQDGSVSVCIHRRGLAEPVHLTYCLREIVDAPDACNENFVASVQPLKMASSAQAAGTKAVPQFTALVTSARVSSCDACV
jgi:hypothetical protein